MEARAQRPRRGQERERVPAPTQPLPRGSARKEARPLRQRALWRKINYEVGLCAHLHAPLHTPAHGHTPAHPSTCTCTHTCTHTRLCMQTDRHASPWTHCLCPLKKAQLQTTPSMSDSSVMGLRTGPTPLLSGHAMLHRAPCQAPVRTKVRTGHQCPEVCLSPEGRHIPWDAVGVKLLELPGCRASIQHSPHPARCPGHPRPTHPAGLPAPQAPLTLSYSGAWGQGQGAARLCPGWLVED